MPRCLQVITSNIDGCVGFIGLGAMGGPMSRRLVSAGYQVMGFDLAPAAMARAVEEGVRTASDARDVGLFAETVFVSLPASAHVEDAVLGSRGCAGAMPAGTVIVDLSSSRPASSRLIAASLEERGIAFLDAPVSRGVPAAQEG